MPLKLNVIARLCDVDQKQLYKKNKTNVKIKANVEKTKIFPKQIFSVLI